MGSGWACDESDKQFTTKVADAWKAVVAGWIRSDTSQHGHEISDLRQVRCHDSKSIHIEKCDFIALAACVREFLIVHDFCTVF